jgi:hypothetical protein
MTQSGTKYSQGSIRAESVSCNSPQEIWKGDFDVLIGACSWDLRSLCLTDAEGLSSRNGILIVPDGRDKAGRRDSSDIALTKFCMGHCDSYIVAAGATESISDIWRKVEQEIGRLHSQHGRALKIFMDASTMPRYLILAIMGQALKRGLASELSIGYAEGAYPEPPHTFENLEELVFRIGPFKPIVIPGYQGQYDPDKKKYFLVSIGFDGWKTYSVVEARDPDRVSILHASPGTVLGYEKRTLDANIALITKFGIPESQVVRAAAGDAVAAWQQLHSRSLECIDEENVHYVCGGTKPHSIALGLRALELGSPTVLYNQPVKHNPVNVLPNGTYWLYKLENTAIPLI